jgi:hypothetical protein
VSEVAKKMERSLWKSIPVNHAAKVTRVHQERKEEWDSQKVSSNIN